MKNILDKSLKACFFLAATTLLFTGCLPESSDESLGPQPAASFDVAPVEGKVNTFLLKNTTTGSSISYWNKNDGNGFVLGNFVDTVYYAAKGSYEVVLRVVTSGGLDETTKTIEVAEDDPEACSGNLALLTGCSSKTWVLNQPDGGALFVGPPGLNEAWWQNSAGDISAADRVCLFDNEYTFTLEGEFIFNNNGTMRVDDEGGAPWPTDIGLEIGCYDMEEIPEQYQAWGSGEHTFTLSANSLKVIGTGAHLGLYKVGEAGTSATPDSQITYTILSISEDLLVVKKEYDWGGWKFTFKAK